MRDRLIDGLIQGDRLAWGAVAVLWALTTVVVLLHRPGPQTPAEDGGRPQTPGAWTWLLFALATGTSLAGLPLSTAIAMPRVRWATVDAPDLVAGGEGWRRLRGPSVQVAGPDIAVPTVDASGRWVLLGLLSGQPAPGLPAAEPAPMRPGAPRLCLPADGSCRPWPVAWPDPARPVALGELVWSHAGALAGVEGALAYDVESALYLRRVEPPPDHDGGDPRTPGAPLLELVGRLGGDVPREPGVIFVLRKVAAGRLKALRLVFTPRSLTHESLPPSFTVQRAEVSLTTGPRVFTWVVRPLLVLTGASLPLAVVALLLAPILRGSRWLRSSRRALPSNRDAEPRQGPGRREASAWIAPYLEAAAVLSAGLATAGPAIVAIAALWGSR